MLRTGALMQKRGPVGAQTIGPRVLAAMPLPDYGADASKADRGKLLIVAGSARRPHCRST